MKKHCKYYDICEKLAKENKDVKCPWFEIQRYIVAPNGIIDEIIPMQFCNKQKAFLSLDYPWVKE
jgi:hypothetical protein